MTAITYYRWSLLSPILVPALALPAALRLHEIYLSFYFQMGGVPYLIWASCVLLRLRGKNEPDAFRAVLWGPALITPLTWLAAPVVAFYNTPKGDSVAVWTLIFMVWATCGAIVFGYLWAGFVIGSVKLLKLCRIVRE